jgi:branched-chain amino acid transport system substrate-binding protein
VLWKNDLADRAMNQDTEKFSKEVGLQVVYNKDFSADATDFTTEMAVIRATNPDIVFFLSQLPQFVTAIREMKEQHLQPKIVWNGIAVPQPTFPSTAGPDSEGILGVSSWVSTLHYKDPIWGDTAGFVKAFEAYKKYTPDYHVAVAAAGAEMLELAVRAAHSLDTEKVRAALAALDVETFWGHIHVDETGKNAQMLITGQIQNGKFVPIYPPSAAQGTLKYPKPAW